MCGAPTKPAEGAGEIHSRKTMGFGRSPFQSAVKVLQGALVLDTLLTNIAVLATPIGAVSKKGTEQGKIRIIRDAVIGIEDCRIVYVGPADTCCSIKAKSTIDCGRRLVTPGLVDAHTHLVFGGWRQNELALKLEGKSYLDILKEGGGILNTVAHTRAADEAELFDKSKALVQIMLQHGTTTAECKSGYGLSVADELKQLRVAQKLNNLGIIDLVSTFMGAHALPVEYKENRQDYINLIVDEMLPKIADQGLAEFCDVFCEASVFASDEARYILTCAKEHGLGIKAHADEIDPSGGAELAAELCCVSAEHLIQASDMGIAAMAKKGVIACLLPATSFYLDKPYARARNMIDEGVPVAVCTDFNPGSCPNLSLQLPMNLSCLKYRLTPAESLTAVTLNAAAAIGRSGTVGSIENGKNADIVIWDAPDLEYIFYRFGTNLVHSVIKSGVTVC